MYVGYIQVSVSLQSPRHTRRENLQELPALPM